MITFQTIGNRAQRQNILAPQSAKRPRFEGYTEAHQDDFRYAQALAELGLKEAFNPNKIAHWILLLRLEPKVSPLYKLVDVDVSDRPKKESESESPQTMKMPHTNQPVIDKVSHALFALVQLPECSTQEEVEALHQFLQEKSCYTPPENLVLAISNRLHGTSFSLQKLLEWK